MEYRKSLRNPTQKLENVDGHQTYNKELDKPTNKDMIINYDSCQKHSIIARETSTKLII